MSSKERNFNPLADDTGAGKGVLGQVFTREVIIPAASVLTLRATPVTLVPAPGAGKVIEFLGATIVLKYKSPAFTESTANLAFQYTNGSGATLATTEATGFIDQAADTVINVVPLKDIIMVANAPVVLHNNGAAEYGNAGAGALKVKVSYKLHSTS